MKSAVIGVIIGGVLAALVAGGTSCGINHKSDEYACTTSAQCNSGRKCVEGFCTISGPPDAPKRDAANGCPTGCTSCNVAQKTCTVDCSLTNCDAALTCPAGYHCDFQCKGDNACRNGINCGAAASCTIECTGTSSCRNIACGPGPCDVSCTGAQSCRSVACGASCACDVTCIGPGSCIAPITCTSPGCINAGGSGCTSVPAFCHSC